MNGLNFYLSRAKAEGYRDQLITQALGQIKYRAKLIGQTLGMRNVAFTDITFSGAEPSPRPPMMMRGMAMAEMASDMAAPTARGGETDVSITIHATVELSK
jgi:predicted secreted protein